MENKIKKDTPSTLLLFKKFKNFFDKDNKLVPPDLKSNLVSIWNSLATQLDLESSEIAKMLAQLSDLKVAENIDIPLDTLINKVPYKLAVASTFLPLRKEEKTTVVAISNPFDDHLHEMIQFIFGINYRCEIAPPKFWSSPLPLLTIETRA